MVHQQRDRWWTVKFLTCLLVSACLAGSEADPLGSAMQLEDGDAFATDRMEVAISSQPVGLRRPLVERLASADREDVLTVLHRMIQDEDVGAAAAAIDGLAKRWPTSIQDAELIRTLIPRTGPSSDAACRFAAAINDDEALQALADRSTARVEDLPSEQALRKLLGLPGGCGPDGWNAAVAALRDRNAVALDKAETLLAGSQMDAIAAITLVAGMRPIGSRATQILLRAAEHPDHTVRNCAISILATCSSPPAVAWRKQVDNDKIAVAAAGGAESQLASTTPAIAQAVAARPTLVTATSAVPPPAKGSATWITWLIVAIVAMGGLAVWRMRSRRPAPSTKPTIGKHITWAR
jgi:hypothetical protein